MERSRRRYCLAVVLAAVIGCRGVAHAQEAGESSPAAAPAPSAQLSADAALARATTYYETGQYAECVAAFEGLLQPASPRALSSPKQIEDARIYYAACLMAQGRMQDADAQFRAAIEENPQLAVPSSLVFPQAVIDRFIVIREQMLDEIREAQERQARKARQEAREARERAEAERRRIAALERLAGQETVVVKNRRWMASLPFGIGQIQNRDYALGAVFLTSEVAMVGTAITAVSIQLGLYAKANRGGGLTDAGARQLTRNLHTAHVVTWSALGGFAATALAGIIEANLSFVPEFREGVRQRSGAVPREKAARGGLRLAPSIGPMPSGAQVGVIGRF